jgi:hypothetical protein
MDITMYQGTKVPPHRYLDYTNIDIYTIHIASNDELLQIIRSLGLQLYNRAAVANPIPPPNNRPAWAGFKTLKEGGAKIMKLRV